MLKITKHFLIFILALFSFSVLAAVPKQVVQTKSSEKTPATSQKETKLRKKIQALQKKLTVQNSVLEKQRRQQAAIINNPLGIAFDGPSYILPFYYTSKPYQEIYAGQTPDNQSLKKAEFKAQLSLLLPIFYRMFHKNLGLDFSYTQLAYWQFYAKSQYFRETDYEPAIFLTGHALKNAEWRFGIVHQSNGKGGTDERSWNRLYVDWRISGTNWLISIKPWLLVFKSESSSLHNSDIPDYLGHGRVVLAYHAYSQTFSIMFRNALESGFRRGAIEVDWNFPLPFTKKLRGYVQGFSGYGQSLIEYNHYTNAVGIGIALSDWI